MRPMNSQLLKDARANHDDLDNQNHPSTAQLVSWIGTDTGAKHGSHVLEGWKRLRSVVPHSHSSAREQLTAPKRDILRVDDIFTAGLQNPKGTNKARKRDDAAGHLDLIPIGEGADSGEHAYDGRVLVSADTFHHVHGLDWLSLVDTFHLSGIVVFFAASHVERGVFDVRRAGAVFGNWRSHDECDADQQVNQASII